MTCRFGSLLVLVFALPLALEIDEVMRLWLKAPPPCASPICLAILLTMVLERISEGYWMAVLSIGRGVGLIPPASVCRGSSGLAWGGRCCLRDSACGEFVWAWFQAI